MEARFAHGTETVVVGGGNSAGQAAVFLSRSAECTHVLVREGPSTTMSSYLSERIDSDPQIRLWTHTEVVALHGDDRLEAVTVRDRRSGDETRIAPRALFIMIGAAPNTDWLDGLVELDDKGFVVTGRDGAPFVTSHPGVWAVGDIRAGSVKRVAAAVGEGSVVVSGVHRYLDRL